MGISEIFKRTRDTRLHLPGYHSLIIRYRDDARGGVGLFINTFNFKIREDLTVFIPHMFESILIDIDSKTNKSMVGVIYTVDQIPYIMYNVY